MMALHIIQVPSASEQWKTSELKEYKTEISKYNFKHKQNMQKIILYKNKEMREELRIHIDLNDILKDCTRQLKEHPEKNSREKIGKK